MEYKRRSCGALFQIGIVSYTTTAAILVLHFPIKTCLCYSVLRLLFHYPRSFFFSACVFCYACRTYNTIRRHGGETVCVGVIWIANFCVKFKLCRLIWSGKFLLRAEVRRINNRINKQSIRATHGFSVSKAGRVSSCLVKLLNPMIALRARAWNCNDVYIGGRVIRRVVL